MRTSRCKCIATLLAIFLLHLSTFAKQALAGAEYVVIRDANNPACKLINAGNVSYDFEIASTEVTNREYCKFLNSVATLADPLGLYSPLMGIHFWGGIIRQADDNGTYSYVCKDGYHNYPVVFVSWFDAIRYVNWLHYGKPNHGSAVIGTTEGNTAYGAYNTNDFNNNSKALLSCKRRNQTAEYWLPNRNEWIKAGFYNGKGSYYQYATQSNSLPASMPPSDKVKNAANYYSNRWALPYPHLNDVGSYVDVKSYYGTYDQAGNVMEWIEDTLNNHRMALGGSLFMYEYALPITYWDSETPGTKLSTFGFRVARKINAKEIPFSNQISQEANYKIQEKQTLLSDFQGMAFVKVDNPSNPSDYNGYGGIDYEYYIGKYEISNKQYVEFLNAVVVYDDPYSLYSNDMNQGVLGGIIREGNKGDYHYKVKDGWGNRPVNYVSWFDIARFANWYHYGKPQKGVSELGTTEGTATFGGYDTTGFTNLESSQLIRNRGALYYIPNENEWYKAAYYDPEKIGFRKYWDYPERTDNAPNNKKKPGDQYSANYQIGSSFSEGPPFYLSEVDAYPQALSYYGTNCQGGNVWEWLENWRNASGKQAWRGSEKVKAVRGGSFGYTEIGLHVRNTDPADPKHKTYVHGARLARAITEKGYQAETNGYIKKFMSLKNKTHQKYIIIICTFIGFIVGCIFTLLTFRLYKKIFCTKLHIARCQ